MVKPVDPTAWGELVELQHGIVTRAQYRSHGITDDAVRRHLGDRTWVRLESGLFATHSAPLGPEARVDAALLGVGGLVVAAAETALWLADPRQSSPPLVHVGVVEGRRVAKRPGVRVHHLADLGPERVLWNSAPPRVRVEPAALDVANEARTIDALVAGLTKVVRQRLTTVPRLRESLAARPRMHERRLVEEILADVEQGAQSPLEVRDLRNDRAHGLVAGTRQVIRKGGAGIQWLDVVFSGNGLWRSVVKELDGRLGHEGVDEEWRDMKRDNTSERLGQSHLRYGWRQMASEPCLIAIEQHAVLTLNGWRTPLHPCSRSCPVAVAVA